MEIADYSTYDQAVSMGDIFGFGKPIDEVSTAVAAGHALIRVGPRGPPDGCRARRHPRRAAR